MVPHIKSYCKQYYIVSVPCFRQPWPACQPELLPSFYVEAKEREEAAEEK